MTVPTYEQAIAEPERNANPPLLEIDRVRVEYRRDDSAVVALDEVSLTISEGEFVCVVGASGCGKTTMLKTVDGLIQPTAGRVLVRGRPADPRGHEVATVFQHDALFPWRTVLDNVCLGLELRGVPKRIRVERARECLRLVNLPDVESYYPRELSGGMRQRVNLARGLAVDPEILLMDEPFAALDAQTREIMQDELLQIWARSRKTVLFITHQLDEAVLLGDRVVVMGSHPGHVREDIAVDIPRPRTLQTKRTAEFQAYVDRVWTLIEGEVRSSMADEADGR